MKPYWIGATLFLVGCTETRTTNESQTAKHDIISITGSAILPSPTGPIPIPLDLRIERTGSEDIKAEMLSKTKIDSAAIAQQVGDTVGRLVDAGIAKMTGLQPRGLSLTEGGGLAGAGTAVAWALREMMARKREEKALIEVKEARNQAQKDAFDLAKKLPPESA